MKVRTRLTLVFLTVVIGSIVTVGAVTVVITRTAIRRMVANESRQMVGTIADALEIGLDTLENDAREAIPPRLREFVLDRRIGETGFYFILDSGGTYRIHPNPAVEGENWSGEQPFIDDILAQSRNPEAPRFTRYISPKTGEWKQVYLETVREGELIVASSAWEHEMYAPLQRIYLFLAGVLSAAIAVAVLLALRVSHTMGSVLQTIAGSLTAVADGDLTARIAVNHWSRETQEAAESFNRAIPDRLHGVVARVQRLANKSSDLGARLKADVDQSIDSIEGVSKRITDLDADIETLAEATGESDRAAEALREHMTVLETQAGEQASAATESSAAIEEISASIASVRRIAERQREQSSQLLTELQRNQTAVDSLHRAIVDIRTRVEDVSEFNRIINEVADQTHVLAMNAAIQAARAGDAGRGFSVLAGEIRELADSSNYNAGQVGTAIGQISEAISETVAAGGHVSTYFEQLRETAESFINAFEEINRSTGELDGAAREIVSATTQIADGAEQVRERTVAVRDAADSVNSVVVRARNIADHSRNAFTTIRRGAEEVIEMQQEINTISQWNGRNNQRLAQRTTHFTTADDNHETGYRITQGLASHQRWIDTLVTLVDSGSPKDARTLAGSFPSAASCEFGHWLSGLDVRTEHGHTDGDRNATSQSAEALAVLQATHDEFHQSIRAALESAIHEHRGLVREDLTQIRAVSHRMVEEIDRLDEAIDTISS